MNGLPIPRAQSTPGRSDPPVKPTSEVAHQPGQQPAVLADALEQLDNAQRRWVRAKREMETAERQCLALMRGIRALREDGHGSAVECSTERSRAPRDNGGACGGTRLGNPCDEDGLTR